MLTCFYNIKGTIHFEFVHEWTTVNQTFYVEELKRLVDVMRRKQGEFVERVLIDST
jgi:hypothetical protein